MPLETYLIYLAAVAVFFATPPDTSQLLIVSNAIRHGLRRSLWTVAGDLSANALQMTAAAFGLAAVIATSAQAFAVIKWAGVAYLAWIGLSLMLRAEPEMRTGAGVAGTRLRLFRQGFVTSLANPFAVVFFGALFPQFIDPALPLLPQLLILGATYLAVDGAILLGWGWLGRRAAGLIGTRSRAVVNRVCGGLMIAAAGLLALKDPEPAR
ncbi:LysE family translocator [Sulfitobacter sp. D35]|uniref:LysE family translocator n=1 Tax=Sulfitobacter sp. D35 TaxID=3083252 RepID=UPI00296F341B|nr:LysE family translocator [Sulfitobacter sp. D35]MDW4500098.1 LysE family translocator [Sulfitobacter sp. D35]